MIHYADHLEKMVGDALNNARIEFVHGSEFPVPLDFYIPQKDIHIEVKQYYTPRIAQQMTRADNIIVLQGKKSVEAFCELLKNQK